MTGFVGVMALAGGMHGWFLRTLAWPARASLLAAALLLINPGIYTDIAGDALLAAVLLLQRWRAPHPVHAPE